MIAVLFEVRIASGQAEDYLAEAQALQALLEQVDGFVSVERFQSLSHPDKLLSLSYWRDEAAVTRWRTEPRHREAQELGRSSVFAGYRLRVADVIRDYQMHDSRAEAPADSREHHGG